VKEKPNASPSPESIVRLARHYQHKEHAMGDDQRHDTAADQQSMQIIEASSEVGLAIHLLHPFARGGALHCHSHHHELCYVLEGVLAARHADQVVVLHAGELLNTPPGVEHTYWNPAATPTRLLLIYTPGAAADVLGQLAQGGNTSSSVGECEARRYT
jgi:uncharacterized cupin superfamily protein